MSLNPDSNVKYTALYDNEFATTLGVLIVTITLLAEVGWHAPMSTRYLNREVDVR